MGLGPSTGWGAGRGGRTAAAGNAPRSRQGYPGTQLFRGSLGHVPDLLASPKRGSLWGRSWDIVARDDHSEGAHRAGVWTLERCADSAFYMVSLYLPGLPNSATQAPQNLFEQQKKSMVALVRHVLTFS